MATIHSISGSTRYLLKGKKPINRKNFSKLIFDEMQHFYSHYVEIFAETKTNTARIQDEKIFGPRS